MKATLIYKNKTILEGGFVVELILWKLPKETKERPHGFKYRLYFGDRQGKCLVRYDNEAGKGDHKHIEDKEYHYEFVDKEKLIKDFYTDISRFI